MKKLEMLRQTDGTELDKLRALMKKKKEEVESNGGEIQFLKEYGQKFKDDKDQLQFSGMGKDGIFAFGQKLVVYYKEQYPEVETKSQNTMNFDEVTAELIEKKMNVDMLKAFISHKGSEPSGNKAELIEQAKSLL